SPRLVVSVRPRESVFNRGTSLLRDFELDRSARLLLDHGATIPDPAATRIGHPLAGERDGGRGACCRGHQRHRMAHIGKLAQNVNKLRPGDVLSSKSA